MSERTCLATTAWPEQKRRNVENDKPGAIVRGKSKRESVTVESSPSPSSSTIQQNQFLNGKNIWNLLEIPRAYPLPYAMSVKKLHQRQQPRLRHLQFHSTALDGLDLGMSGFLLGRSRQRVDVLEDIG